MSEHLNPVATASADPAQLVIGVERIGKALNLISANVKGNADDRFNEESKKARIVQQKEALKIVAQTIQAMIQELEQAGGDNTHIRELSAIQQSCVSACQDMNMKFTMNILGMQQLQHLRWQKQSILLRTRIIYRMLVT